MPGSLIEWTGGHPRGGRAAQAQGLAVEACQRRARLGLPGGRVLCRVGGSQHLPGVVWECEYPDLAAWRRDGMGHEASPERRAIRRHLEGGLEAIERTVWSVAHGDPGALKAQPVAVVNAYYPAPGRKADVLRQRIHASEVRRALGFRCGRVLARAPGHAGGALPAVVWQMDYASPEERGREGEAVMATPEFQTVMAHMRTLVERFERALYASPPPADGARAVSAGPARRS